MKRYPIMRRVLTVAPADPNAPEPAPLGRTIVALLIAQVLLMTCEVGLVVVLGFIAGGWLVSVSAGVAVFVIVRLRRRVRRASREHKLHARATRKLAEIEALLDELESEL